MIKTEWHPNWKYQIPSIIKIITNNFLQFNCDFNLQRIKRKQQQQYINKK